MRSSTSRAPRRPGRSPMPTSSRSTPRPSRMYRVHGTSRRGPHRAVAVHGVPVPRRSPHEPYVADLADRLRTAGSAPERPTRWVSTGAPGGTCVRCRDCAVPLPTWGPRATPRRARVDPALATGNARLADRRTKSGGIVTDTHRAPGRPPGGRRSGTKAMGGHAEERLPCSLPGR